MKRFAKLTLPVNLLLSGMTTSATSELTIFPNAPPMTTPTARSRTFPRMADSLNSLKIATFFCGVFEVQVFHKQQLVRTVFNISKSGGTQRPTRRAGVRHPAARIPAPLFAHGIVTVLTAEISRRASAVKTGRRRHFGRGNGPKTAEI